jgi:alkylation response protein AidB-like acyl-CoA dehydrogenase
MKHPSVLLPDDMIAAIRSYAADAEQLGRLSPEQLQLIAEQRWFHLFVPEAYGGLNLSLPQAVRLEESIAFADGSLGWVVTLCAGASLFVGYFEEAVAKSIFANPRVCLAGSGHVGGTANTIAEGFEVTGSWPHASGALHADYFTANCLIKKTGKIQSFIFTREEVTIQPNWNYMGLQATAGHSFSVEKLIVPSNHAFTIEPAYARLHQPVYKFPFLPLAETTIAANLSGMCLYFLDLAEAIIFKKEHTDPAAKSLALRGIRLLAEASTTIQTLREQFYAVLDQSWQAHVMNHHLEAETLSAISNTSRQLAHQARNWVNLVYPHCGLTAARTDSAINMVWRNIHTASQHPLLNSG